MKQPESPLVVVVGPTGVGKTALAIDLARGLHGEIVSADSRQVYQGMDVGTAKPSVRELSLVRHHLVDMIRPDQWLTVAEFQSAAYHVIDDLLRTHTLPLLVGGTGQYVTAVVDGWTIPQVPPHPQIRAELEAFANKHGHDALHNRLAEVDPSAAHSIDSRNVRRVVRALEVVTVVGRPISELQQRKAPPYDILQLGLTRPRSSLYQIIDRRIEHMVEAGLVDEVKRLVHAGYDWGLPSMSSVGYRQIGAYLRSELTLQQAIAAIKKDTRRLVRKQYNWFGLTNPLIHWFDLDETRSGEVLGFVARWLAGQADATVD